MFALMRLTKCNEHLRRPISMAARYSHLNLLNKNLKRFMASRKGCREEEIQRCSAKKSNKTRIGRERESGRGHHHQTVIEDAHNNHHNGQQHRGQKSQQGWYRQKCDNGKTQSASTSRSATAKSLPQRLDDVYYKQTDKGTRNYKQTWIEFPEQPKRSKVVPSCFRETTESARDRRFRRSDRDEHQHRNDVNYFREDPSAAIHDGDAAHYKATQIHKKIRTFGNRRMLRSKSRMNLPKNITQRRAAQWRKLRDMIRLQCLSEISRNAAKVAALI